VCGLDSTVSGQGPVAGCCECGDEPSGSCATELVHHTSWPTCNSDVQKVLLMEKINIGRVVCSSSGTNGYPVETLLLN
jgi:hypothetical protein